MKTAIFCLFLFIQVFSYGQISIDKSQAGEFYLIREAYYIKDDSTYNINENFIDKTTGIALIPFNDSTIISIDHGGIDNVLFIGYGKKIKNPGFDVSRDDAEFYLWSFIEPNNSERQKAYILKEYVTGRFEHRGVNFYYFNIRFADNSQYQFYASVIKYDPTKKKSK
jgi:hypothetical protein